MKNIVILVDVQNGFVNTEYAEESFKRIVRLLDRRIFDVVIATKYWNEEGSIISRFMEWDKLCTEEEQDLRAEIKPYVDYITSKNTYSSMTEEMKELLKTVNGGTFPEYVFVLGFDTECCVLSTATDLFELGIRPLVLTEYCGSHDGERYHEAGIISMEHLIGPKFLIGGEVNEAVDLNRIADICLK
jgi:nicotinamidase-related amidase